MLDIEAMRSEARARLPEHVFDFVDSGAGVEATREANVHAWDDWWLCPRVLRDVSAIETSTALAGTEVALPVILGPTSRQCVVHPEGERAGARAAAARGTIYCLATRATTDMADVAAASGSGGRWFQVFVGADRDRTAETVRRAESLGYSALLLTVDKPVAGSRPREEAHGPWKLPPGVAVADHLGDGVVSDTGPLTSPWDASLSWSALETIARAVDIPVIVKGVLSAADAALAVEHGAAGVVVSNHGGRQLDGLVPTAVALEEVAVAIGDRATVLVDGGVDSGTDVLRALALGADAVLLGRTMLWALAIGGEQGLLMLIDQLHVELVTAMAIMGCVEVAEIDRSCLRPRTERFGSHEKALP